MTERDPSQPDFHKLFEAVPGLYVALLPDAPRYTIVAVTDAYACATMTRREEIVGRGLFEVFPDNPSGPAATGVSTLRTSLGRVLTTRLPDAMAVRRYDIRRSAGSGGQLEERWWSPKNSPVIGPGGDVAYIIHAIEDVTQEHRLEADDLKDANASLEAIIENIPLMLFMKDGTSLKFLRCNRACEDLLGRPRDMLIGKSDYDLWPQAQAEFFVEKDRATLTSGTIVDIPEEPIQTRYQGVRLLHTKKVPIRDAAGKPIYLLGISEDITERRRLEKQQQFLAEVSVALSVSLDYEQTLATVARLVVQNVADWCAIDVVDEQGQLRRLKVTSADPEKAALCAVLERMPPDRGLPHFMRSVIESKRSLIVEHVTPEYVESIAQGPEHLQALLATDVTSFIAMPLLLRGEPLGAILLGYTTRSHFSTHTATFVWPKRWQTARLWQSRMPVSTARPSTRPNSVIKCSASWLMTCGIHFPRSCCRPRH